MLVIICSERNLFKLGSTGEYCRRSSLSPNGKKASNCFHKVWIPGSTHTDVDTTALVWRIAGKAWELHLQKRVTNREGNNRMKPVVDVLSLGYKKMESSSLGTFNKKITAMKEGHATDMEVDNISLCRLTISHTELAEEGAVEYGEVSVLHDEQA